MANPETPVSQRLFHVCLSGQGETVQDMDLLLGRFGGGSVVFLWACSAAVEDRLRLTTRQQNDLLEVFRVCSATAA